jgi:hypothetical protein
MNGENMRRGSCFPAQKKNYQRPQFSTERPYLAEPGLFCLIKVYAGEKNYDPLHLNRGQTIIELK